MSDDRFAGLRHKADALEQLGNTWIYVPIRELREVLDALREVVDAVEGSERDKWRADYTKHELAHVKQCLTAIIDAADDNDPESVRQIARTTFAWIESHER